MFGRMWRSTMRADDAPRMRSASRKGAERSVSTCARATRPKCGVSVMPTMTTTISVEGPNTATIASASTSEGNEAMTSNRMSTKRSARADSEAARMPRRVPATSATAIALSATAIATEAPCTSRENMSRPRWSVPSQCAAEGPAKRFITSSRSGSCVATQGANTAAPITASTSANPTAPGKLLQTRRSTSSADRHAFISASRPWRRAGACADRSRNRTGRRPG